MNGWKLFVPGEHVGGFLICIVEGKGTNTKVARKL